VGTGILLRYLNGRTCADDDAERDGDDDDDGYLHRSTKPGIEIRSCGVFEAQVDTSASWMRKLRLSHLQNTLWWRQSARWQVALQ